MATGLTVHRNSAHQAGVGTIFDRVLTELVAKMREMKMDKTELGCLRSVILFNPGTLLIHFLYISDKIKQFLPLSFHSLSLINIALTFDLLVLLC